MSVKVSDPKDPVVSVVDELEQQLAAARKEKTLARVPALRRLRNVVRTYMIIGGLLQLFMPMVGVNLRQLHSAVNWLGSDLISVSAFFLYATVQWMWTATILLLLFAYARFLKQFRENQVHDIEDTTAMILHLWNFALLFAIINPVLAIAMLGVSAASGEYADRTVSGSISGGIGVVVFYFVIRHYVKTAQAELPLLAAAVGDNAPRGHYRAWKPLFLTLLVGASVVLGLGYWLGGTLSWLSGTASLNSVATVDQTLAEVSKTINASLPKQVNSETRLDIITSSPGKKLTYIYTLVNLSVADLNQAQFIEKVKEHLVNSYRSDPGMADFRRMQVELSYVYRDKHGETVATVTVSPSDF